MKNKSKSTSKPFPTNENIAHPCWGNCEACDEGDFLMFGRFQGELKELCRDCEKR